jgi:hypothetical protein
MKVTDFLKLNLQLFADGGGGAGAGEGAASGEGAQVAAVQTGDDAKAVAAKRAAEYQEFKTKFKAEYDAEVQGVIKSRLKTAKDNEKAASAYRAKTEKVFEALGMKYGLGADKVDEILSEVEKDNSYYEDEAIRRGMDVAELRRVTAVERENAQYRARDAAAAARAEIDRKYQALLNQVPEVQAAYPGFDFNKESEANPLFRKLCAMGIPMKNAYESTHMDEILSRGMQYAAQTAAAKTQAVQNHNRQRPDENGLGGNGKAEAKIDISKLSPAQIQDYIERARRGEVITFT